MPVWVSVPLSSATPVAMAIRSLAISLNQFPDDVSELSDGAEVKVHVDFLSEDYHTQYRTSSLNSKGYPGDYYFEKGDERWTMFKCLHRHEKSTCKCCCPLYHIGQDEAVFKQNALPAYFWSVNGRSKLRPKTEGQGIMVSAVWDEFRGFGLPLTSEEVEKVNRARETSGIPLIKEGESPGLIFFQYGNAKGKQGYWDGAKFQVQCADFIDVIETLHPNMQILLEVDHSSGHLKEQSDGLTVSTMNVKWGGKSIAKRDTVIEEGCLGPDPPEINGIKLTIGATQHMIFEAGHPGPYFEKTASRADREMTEKEKVSALKKFERAQEQRKKSAERDGLQMEEEIDSQPSFIVKGFEGQNKGILQILYERGLYVEGMRGKQDQAKKEKLEMNLQADKILPPHLDAHAVLGGCPDFYYEKTALQFLVESRGHILLPSVVCTPETAGGGIEYGWGKLKFEQRKENNGAVKLESGLKFIERVRRLCMNKDVLPMTRIFKYQRRARDYIRMYLDLGEREGKSAPSHSVLERMRRKSKTHRNIMEIDRDFVRE